MKFGSTCGPGSSGCEPLDLVLSLQQKQFRQYKLIESLQWLNVDYNGNEKQRLRGQLIESVFWVDCFKVSKSTKRLNI